VCGAGHAGVRSGAANLHPMKRLLAVTAVAALVGGAVPAVAAPRKAPVHPSCAVPSGAMVVSPKAPLETQLDTPVGALGLTSTEVGDLWVDLKDVPASQRGKVVLELAYDNPASDYDLVVNGVNDLSTDNPEYDEVKAGHCKRVSLALEVFTGVPVDTLTLSARVTPTS
jgi:hypothetical protein